MSQVNPILKLLADGQFHSGEEIGEILGVTRSAVWQTLKRLLPAHFEIQAVRGRGYCIPDGLELLDGMMIRAELGEAEAQLAQLEIIESVDSTNRYVLNKPNVESGFALIAEQQTAGRGRLGRSWISPFGRNIYLSLLWRFPEGSASLTGLSLAVGVSVARALQLYGVKGINLKWPNDIVYESQKLGGILLELNGDVVGPCQVVIGIGLNVHMPAALSTGIAQPWTDVYSILRQQPQRNRLVGLVLRELLLMLPRFQKFGLASFRESWQQLDALYNQPVVVQSLQEQVFGIAKGVDELGYLLVDTKGKLQRFSSAEVSVRKSI